jgi:hypothetical protein
MEHMTIEYEPVSETQELTWAEEMCSNTKNGVVGEVRYFKCPCCNKRIRQHYTVDWGHWYWEGWKPDAEAHLAWCRFKAWLSRTLRLSKKP